MASNLGDLVIGLGANIASLQSDFVKAQQLTDAAVGNINVSINGIGANANFNNISSQVQGLISQFESLKATIASVAGATIGISGARDVLDMADAYQNVENRLRQTVSDAQSLHDVQTKILGVANETGDSLDNSARLYQRLEQIIKGAGKTQADAQTEALNLTKTLNQEIVLSGVSAGEASRATLDLVHALSNGVAHAQQLRPIMRQFPDLIKQFADGMGVSQKKFEDMVKVGIPAQTLLDAIANKASDINDRFSYMPMTFARAWNVLSNNIEVYIGQAAQASAAGDMIKAGIIEIANHIGIIASGAADVAVAMGIWLGGKTLSAAGGMLSTLKDMVLAQGAYKTEAILTAEADLANAVAMGESTKTTLEKVAAITELKIAENEDIKNKAMALESEIALLEAQERSIPIGVDMIASGNRLAAARKELAEQNALLAKSEEVLDVAFSKQEIAENAAYLATIKNAEANAALSASQIEATSALGLFSRAGMSLFTMLGGWPMIIMAAGTALYYFVTAQTEAAKFADKLKKATDDLTESTDKNTKANLDNLKSLNGLSDAKLRDAKADEQAILRKLDLARANGASDGQILMLTYQLYKASSAVEALTEAQDKANKAIEIAQWQKIGEGIAKSTDMISDWVGKIPSSIKLTIDQALAIDKMQDAFNSVSAPIGNINSKVNGLVDIFISATASVFGFSNALRSITGLPQIDNSEFLTSMNKEEDQLDRMIALYGKGKEAEVRYVLEKEIAAKTANLTIEAARQEEQMLRDGAASAIAKAKSYDEMVASSKAATNASKDQAQALRDAQKIHDDYINSFNKLNEDINNYSEDLNGPYAQAQKNYEKIINDINDTFLKALADQQDYNTAQDQATLQMIRAKNAYDEINKRISEQHDLLQQGQIDIDDELHLMGLTGTARQAEAEALQKRNELEKQGLTFDGQSLASMKDRNKALDEGQAKFAADRKALLDMQEAEKLNEQATQGWVQAFSSGFDAILQTSGNIWARMKAGFSSLVDAIIQQFERLVIINPIMNAIFGGAAGFSLLPSLANAFGGTTALNQTGASIAASTGGSTVGSMTGAAGTAGSMSGISSLLSSATWISAGKSIWSGFSSMFGTDSMTQGVTQSMFGTWIKDGNDAYFNASGLTNILSILGGAYAGLNRASNADGAFGKVGGGLAYGLGTYTLGVGAAGAIAGGSLGAGFSAMGATALGPVGWVALGAMALDMLTGGGLFGTSYKPTGKSQSDISTGASGTDITNSYEESKKKALFGGTSYRWSSIAESDEQKAWVTSFDKTIGQVRDSAARALGTNVADAVSASFHQVFDKNGNVTKNVSTVLGQTYTETMDEFVKRVQAENVIAQIDAALGTQEASKIANAYRSNADTLSDAAQMLLQAQADVQHHMALMKDNTSLTDIAQVVGALNAAGETLLQTYGRLQTETQALRNSLDLSGGSINATGIAFVKFADAAATAAGGADALSSLMQSFAQAFYSAQELSAQNVTNTRNASDVALGALGLDTGISESDFRAAYESALPTMTAEQLVQWQQAGVLLAAADQALQSYNDDLQKAADAAQQAADAITQAQTSYAGIVQQLQQGLAEIGHPQSDFVKGLTTIGTAMESTDAQLQAAAQAAGMAGAREEDLTLARTYAAAQAEVLAGQLAASSEDIVAKLYSVSTASTSAGSGLKTVASGIQSIQSAVDAFRKSMLLDSSLSPLNTQQQYTEALKQLAQTGDQRTAQTALTLARSLMASGNDYAQAFDMITGMVRPPATSSTSSTASASASASTQLSASDRATLAMQLAQNVADFAGFKGESFSDVAKEWGFSLTKLSSDLGLKDQSIDDYLASLQQTSYGLDDLANMVSEQVDRIVEAINNISAADPSIPGSDARQSEATIPAMTIPIVQPIVESQQEQTDLQQKQLDATNAQNDLLIALTRALVSSNDDTTQATVTVGSKVDALTKVMSTLSNNVTARGVRTENNVVFAI